MEQARRQSLDHTTINNALETYERQTQLARSAAAAFFAK